MSEGLFAFVHMHRAVEVTLLADPLQSVPIQMVLPNRYGTVLSQDPFSTDEMERYIGNAETSRESKDGPWGQRRAEDSDQASDREG